MEDQSLSGDSFGEEAEPIPKMVNTDEQQQMPKKVEVPVRLIVPTIKIIKRIPLEPWQLRAYYGIGDPNNSLEPLPTSFSDDEEEGESDRSLDITTSSSANDAETLRNIVKEEEEEESIENVRELLAMTAIEDENIKLTPDVGQIDDDDEDGDHSYLTNLRNSTGRTPMPPKRLILNPKKQKYDEA